MKTLINLIAILICNNLIAKDLVSTAIIESSDTFPKGVFSYGIFNSNSNFIGYFDENSNNTNLGSLFSDNFTFNDIVDEDIADRRAITRGALSAYGITDFDESAGEHQGNLDIQTEVNTIFLGYGASENLSFFTILPRVKVGINFDNKFTKSEKLKNLISELNKDGNYSKVKEINSKLENPILYKLNEYGYNPNYISTREDWGDLRLISRYRFFKNDFFQSTAGLISVLPTAKTDHLNDFLKLYLGDGQWDLGVQSLNEFKLSNQLRFLSSIEYVNQISSSEEIRVPLNSNSPLSPDIDRNTKQDFGNTYKVSHQFNFQLNKLLSFAAGHVFQYKNYDSYSGSKYSSERYNYLSKNTLQKAHSVYGGITLNTIDSFLKKKFILPLQANIGYSKIIAGRNIPQSEEILLSLTGFYK